MKKFITFMATSYFEAFKDEHYNEAQISKEGIDKGMDYASNGEVQAMAEVDSANNKKRFIMEVMDKMERSGIITDATYQEWMEEKSALIKEYQETENYKKLAKEIEERDQEEEEDEEW